MLLLTAVIYAVFNLGVFKDVQIEKGPYAELHLVYKDHVGPYHYIGDVIKEVEKFFKENNLDCPITFGQYLDDPRVVEHERLKSRGGCLHEGFPENFSTDLKKMLIPAGEYYIAHFSGSPWIGPYKVYGKVFEKAAQDGNGLKGPVIEIYEAFGTEGMRTTYLFPLSPRP